MVQIEKNVNVRKCKDFATISLISHVSKEVFKVLNRKLTSNLNKLMLTKQFGFFKEKIKIYASGFLRSTGKSISIK